MQEPFVDNNGAIRQKPRPDDRVLIDRANNYFSLLLFSLMFHGLRQCGIKMTRHAGFRVVGRKLFFIQSLKILTAC